MIGSKWFLLILSAIIFLWGCEKESVSPEIFEEMVTEEAFAEDFSNEIIALTEEAIDVTTLNNPIPPMQTQLLSDCVIITRRENSSAGVTVSIDFGTVGCIGRDGRTRKGIIQIVATDMQAQPGSVRTISFIDFSVDGHLISGTIVKTIRRKIGRYQLEVQLIENLEWVHAQTAVLTTRTASIIRQIDFNRIGVLRDNSIRSWGTVTIVRNGNTLIRDVSEEVALLYRFPCRRIVQGVAKLTLNGSREWILDFGDGRCDNLATLNNGRRIRTIRLR